MKPISLSGPALLRWAKRAAYVLLAFYLFYVLAVNLWLNTPLGEWSVNRKPEKFQLHWANGHSFWPGRVALNEVRLQGQVKRIAWQAESTHVSGRVAIWPLLRKQVHVPLVRADNVIGGIRRVTNALPAPPAREGGWQLRFDRIVTDSLRRGNFDDLVLSGLGQAEVGFYKQLRGGPMELMPSTVQFRNAMLRKDNQELLSGAELKAAFAVARHGRNEAPGLRKLEKTDARIFLDGKTSALDIEVSPQGDITYKVVPGRGVAHVDLAVKGGELQPGGQLHWNVPIGGRDAHGNARNDEIDVALEVDRDVHLILKAPPLANGRMALDADLHVRGRQIPLRDPRSVLGRSSGHVVGHWHFTSLRWLGALFPEATWLELDGAGDIDADVQVVSGRLAAGSRIAVPSVDAVADVMGNRLRGKASADIRLDSGADGILRPHLQVAMQQFHAASLKAPDRPYVRGSNLRLTLDAEGINAKTGASQLRQTLKGRLVFNRAQVPDLRVYNAFLPRQHMRFDGGAGFISADLAVDAGGEVGSGRLDIVGQRARMHLAGIELRGDVDINLALRRADLKRHAFTADGSTVAFRNLSFAEPGGDSRSGWWARLRLPSARLDIDQPLNAGGSADVTMRDVGFLLALFSRKKEYPAWIYKLVDAGQAQVDGRVQWKGDTLWLDRMQAHNDRFDLKARLRLQGPQRTGQLYAQWGVLSLGLDLRGNERKFHLVRARPWYDAQPDLLR